MGSLHARVLAQSESCEFVRVIEPRGDIGLPIAERYGAEWAPDFNDLDGIDAVVLAAATEVHAKLAERAINLRRPLLVEKPLAERFEDSARLVALSRDQDVVLMCGLLERFNPAVRTAQTIVGDPVQILAVRHSPFVPRIVTGVATDLLVHDIDLAIRLAGSEPENVKASFGYFHPSSRRNSAEDTADVTMTFATGAVATVSASRVSQRKVRQLSVLEVDRLIEIDLLRRDITIYRHVADAPAADGIGYRQQTVIEIPTIPFGEEPLVAQLRHFLSLLGGDREAAEAERDSILPAHRAVHEAKLSASSAQ
jgi:predicted dehydrogenase